MNGIYEGPLYPRVVGDADTRDIHWSPTVRTLGVEVRKGIGRQDAPALYPGMVQSDRGDWWLGLKPGMTTSVKLSPEGQAPPSDVPAHLEPNDFGEIEDAHRTPEEKYADLVARVERLERLVESMPVSPLDAG